MLPVEPSILINASMPESTATLDTSGIVLSDLSGDSVRRAAGGAVNLDLGGNATLVCADPAVTISNMSIWVWSAITGNSFGVATAAGVTVSDGLNQGSVITVGQTAIGTVQYSDETGLDITFNAAATPALVQTFVRALTYVNASPADHIGFLYLDIYINGSDGSEATANVNVTIAPDSAQIFTPGTDDLVGTAGADVFQSEQRYITMGDKLDGGGGNDVFRLTGDGDIHPNAFDLHVMTSITGIETIEGSDEDDFIGINAADLARLEKLDGKGGNNYLRIFGENVTVDLSNTDIANFGLISLQDDGLNITVDNFETADLIHGSLSASDVLNVTTVEITQGQRLALHRQGIDTVTAIDSITHLSQTSVYHAARVTGLDGDHVAPNGANPVFLDAGGNATIVAEDYISTLGVHINGLSSDATTTLAIDTTKNVRLSHGMAQGSIISVADAATGYRIIGEIRYVYGSSLSIDFYSSATAERVQKVVRALTYASTEGGASREISIQLMDAGGRQTSVTLTVDPQGPVAPTGIIVTGASVSENAATGIGVSVLKAIDANAGDAFTYKLLDDAGGRFAISGGALVVADGSKLDFEQAASHSVTIRATDQTGRFVDKKVTIAVTDVAVETIAGSDKDDVSVGGANDDTIGGGLGNDRLSGGFGNDTLSGGGGKDMLTGGGGKDIFVFGTRLDKKTNVDKIVDFNVRDDTMHLAKSVFSKISKKGVLSKSAFWIGDKAHDASDRIFYDKKTGALFYDQDGNGAKAAIQFAILPKKLSLAANDFFVM